MDICIILFIVYHKLFLYTNQRQGGNIMYKQYLENEQMNFQINRFLEPYYFEKKVQEEVITACSYIHDLESWYTEWNKLANLNYNIKNFELASAYYQLTEFFLEESDQRKNKAYSLFKDAFYKSIPNDLLIFNEVPYEGYALPVAIITHDSADKWLIFHGGFDSYLEELIRLSITHLSDLDDYNILMFEGPGQGMPNKNGLPMTSEWEKPVSTILDFFNLDNVALIGMSLGGYLALKTAAKEKRIKKVIAFDTFYSMEDAFLINAPTGLTNIPDLSDLNTRKSIDNLIEEYTKKNIDLKFKINKAKEIFKKNTPSEILIEIKKYTLNGIESKINQNVLLLAGNNDMYVPTERTLFLKERLTNASTVESFIFYEASGGQHHCQVGNKLLAFDKITKFIHMN